MTSIIKVDQIQTLAGAAPTAADLGINVTGSVLQVVQTISNATSKVVSSTSYISATTSALITPSSASSKILVQWSGHCDSQVGGILYVTAYRDALNLGTGANFSLARMHDVGGSRFLVNQSFILLDAPNTTSSVSYTIYLKMQDGVTCSLRDDILLSRIVLTEIAG